MHPIADVFRPIVHAFASSDVDTLLSNAGFASLAQFLDPFKEVERVGIRNSLYEQTVFLKFGVGFEDRPLPASFGQSSSNQRARGNTVTSRMSMSLSGGPSQREREELFLDSIVDSLSANVGPWASDFPILEVSTLPSPKVHYIEEVPRPLEEKKIPAPGNVQWYEFAKYAILQRREMVEWETFGWPVACLLAVSTSHPEPLNALAELWDLTSKENLYASASLPPGRRDDKIDAWANPEILKYVVLVHDMGAGGGRDGLEDAKALHETISKTYHHTALLPLFTASLTAAKPLVQSAEALTLWRPSIEALVPGVGLSEEDLRASRIFVRDMIVQSLVPFMERAVVVGNEQFIASRKSLGGRLFSAGRKYFGGSNTRSGSPVSSTSSQGWDPTNNYYTFTAQESQSRRLADLAFMIGDYKLAATVYEQIVKDFRQDKAWKYYASASRMNGLALLMIAEQAGRMSFNSDAYLEQAMSTPVTQSDFDGLTAVMLYNEIYQTLGEFQAASRGLVRTALFADEAFSGLLFEQAALSELKSSKRVRRKFGFYMSIAAAQYEKAGLKPLAHRCLSQSTAMYALQKPLYFGDDHRWTNTALGWASIRSHMFHALGRQAFNVGNSEEALGYFIRLIEEVKRDLEGGPVDGWLDDLKMVWEQLGTDHALEYLGNAGITFNPQVVNVTRTKVCIPNYDGAPKSNEEGNDVWERLEKLLQVGVASGKKNVAILGEPFSIDVVLSNPLNARLAIGELTAHTTPSGIDTDIPAFLELEPFESKSITINAKPTSLRPFKISSISYKFHNIIPCTQQLDSKDSSNSPFSISVQPLKPLLSVSFDELPLAIFAGEMTTRSIAIRNEGQLAISGLEFATSHPSFVQEKIEHRSQEGIFSNKLVENKIIKVDRSLRPGESLDVPIRVRGDMVGLQTIQWLFTFRGERSSEAKRIFRTESIMEVVPSLDIRPSITPSLSPEISFLVGINITNVNLPVDAQITQITSIGTHWKLKGLDQVLESTSLSKTQARNLYVGVQPVSQPVGNFTVTQISKFLDGQDVSLDFPDKISCTIESVSRESTDILSDGVIDSLVMTHSRLRLGALKDQLPSIESDLYPNLFTLFNARSIDLVVFWLAPSQGTRGHIHLSEIPVGAKNDLISPILKVADSKSGGIYEETQRLRRLMISELRRSELGGVDNPVIVNLKFQDHWQHDFSSGACVVPIEFYIKNTSWQSQEYQLALHENTSQTIHELPFVGLLTHTGSIEPQNAAIVYADLWITKPGEYDIGKWSLTVYQADRSLQECFVARGHTTTIRVNSI